MVYIKTPDHKHDMDTNFVITLNLFSVIKPRIDTFMALYVDTLAAINIHTLIVV